MYDEKNLNEEEIVGLDEVNEAAAEDTSDKKAADCECDDDDCCESDDCCCGHDHGDEDDEFHGHSVFMENEDGTTEEYAVVDEFEYNGIFYVLVENADGTVTPLKAAGDDGELEFLSEEEFDEVANAYNEAVEMDDEDEDDEDDDDEDDDDEDEEKE